MEETTKNADDNKWEKLRIGLADLNDNTKNLSETMVEQNKMSTKILENLEAIFKKLENIEVLSVYRDFISLFVGKVKEDLGKEVWVVVRNAIDRKRIFKRVDFKQNEMNYISQLARLLRVVNMSVQEF